ncbi:hypothetical protein UlMin_027514 [Ulmus minor]
MGASESTLSSSQRQSDKITTISERSELADPILKKLKSLNISTLILTSPPAEGSLTDILVRKASSSSAPGTVDLKVLLELFSMYHDYQEEKTQKISTNQNKIEVADALTIKLLQRLNYLVSAMKALHKIYQKCVVPTLQVEIGELKGRLTEVISNCDGLYRRIATEGPQSLWSSVKPFAVTAAAATMLYPPLHNSSKAGTGGAGPTILAISYSSFWS